MSREKHFPWLWNPNSCSHWGVGLESLFCAAAATDGAWPGSDSTSTAPAHWNLHGSQASPACAQQENKPICNDHTRDWTCTMALLSLQDHFGSWVFLTRVTLQFIQLLRTKVKIIPFKHPTSYLCLEQSPQAIIDTICNFQAGKANYCLQIWQPRIVSITEWHHLTQCQEDVTQESLFKLVLQFFSQTSVEGWA